MSMNREKLKALRAAINAALVQVGKDHNVNMECGSCSFNDANATMKLEISTIAADGTVVSKEAEDFKKYCHWYDLEPTDLGQSFILRGERYEICGLSTRAKKYPILAKNARGEVYKFPADVTKNLLGHVIT